MAEMYDGTWQEGDGTVHEKDPVALNAFNEEMNTMSTQQLEEYITGLASRTASKSQGDTPDFNTMSNEEIYAYVDKI